jgi:hypothetical protein
MTPPLVSLLALALALALGDGPAVAADTLLHLGPTPPPHGLPEIKAFAISTTDIRPGRAVHGAVETSSNVHYVEARVEYRNVAMHEDGPGKFSITYTVPWWLPPWLRHRGYTLQIIARSIDGIETVREVPVTVR